MSALIIKTLPDASQRVLISISPANYTHTADGLLVLKNSVRMRLYVDQTLLSEQGSFCSRLRLLKFNERMIGLVFELSHVGTKATPIVRSGKSEVSVPLSVLKDIKPGDFPAVRRLPCAYKFVEDKLLVLLPFARP